MQERVNFTPGLRRTKLAKTDTNHEQHSTIVHSFGQGGVARNRLVQPVIPHKRLSLVPI